MNSVVAKDELQWKITDMHVYLRTADGKRGKYLGFKGTDYVRDYWTGEKIGKGTPPHLLKSTGKANK